MLTVVESKVGLFMVFFVYAVYAACTEGIVKAWISRLVHPSQSGGALGFYSGITSLLTFCASSIAGLLWLAHPSAPFLIACTGSVIAGLYLAQKTTTV
jgi:hypothetical protein